VNASVEAPGVVFHGGSTRLIFGALHEGEAADSQNDGARQVLRVLHGAGLRGAELHPNMGRAVWEKFVSVAAINGVFALTRLHAGPLRECRETWELLRRAMEEDEAVAAAKGVPMPLAYVDRTLDMLRGYSPWARPSMLVDLEAGRRLELDALTGTVVRLGREVGVETPIGSTIYAALKPYEDGTPKKPIPS
jgi:2-dehydropantoate 2-reductase